MIKGVVFDLWYTLIYLNDGWRTFNFLKEEFKIPPAQWKSKIKPLFLCKEQPTEESFLEDLKSATQLNFSVDKYAQRMRRQKMADILSCRAYDDSLSVIGQLKSRGLKLGIISNQATFYEPCYFNSPICEYIDAYAFSNRIGVRKPQCEIYHALLNQINIPPENILVVGDNKEDDYSAPKMLNFNALLLNRKGNGSCSNHEICRLDKVIDYVS